MELNRLKTNLFDWMVISHISFKRKSLEKLNKVVAAMFSTYNYIFEDCLVQTRHIIGLPNSSSQETFLDGMVWKVVTCTRTILSWGMGDTTTQPLVGHTMEDCSTKPKAGLRPPTTFSPVPHSQSTNSSSHEVVVQDP